MRRIAEPQLGGGATVDCRPMPSFGPSESGSVAGLTANGQVEAMAHAEASHAHATEVQLDMFGAPTAGDGGSLRAEIADVLGKVRTAPREPWAASDVEHLRNIFGRMAERLPI